MLNQSGVVQAGASDLLVNVPNVAQKVLVVRAGMAIGKRPDLAEAKEVVLRLDSAPIDLTATSAEVPTPLTAGQTGFVTVHYDEQPVPNPPSEGDVPGNTRILEHARITVHNAAPPPSAPNGERPYIRLGDVTFNTIMAVSVAQRQQAFFNSALLASRRRSRSAPTRCRPPASRSLPSPRQGGLNLSGATNASVSIAPNAGIAHAVSNQTATSMTLTLTLTGASVGLHTITVTTNATASTTFSVATVIPAPTLAPAPASAFKNQLMTLTGTNFIAPVTVAFDNGGAIVGPTFSGPGESQTPTQIVLRVPGANANTRGTSPSALPEATSRQTRLRSSERRLLCGVSQQGEESMSVLRIHVVRAALVALAVILLAGLEGSAKQSGTLMSQTATLLNGATTPSMDIEVAGGKTAGTTTKVFLEIGADGNSASPPPDPSLPGSLRFRVTKSGVATPSEFTTAGGADSTTFANKVVVLAKGAENPGDRAGLYVLAIAHITGTSAAEPWKMESRICRPAFAPSRASTRAPSRRSRRPASAAAAPRSPVRTSVPPGGRANHNLSSRGGNTRRLWCFQSGPLFRTRACRARGPGSCRFPMASIASSWASRRS